jgi:curved DNA-binding protein CbpA
MKNDPIVEEIRRIQEAYAAQFNFNLKAIYQDLKQQQRTSSRKYHWLPARRL